MLETIENNVIDRLVDIYLHKEWWVEEKDKLPYNIAYNYYDKLYKQGNILTYEKDGEIFGYIEYWKINFEQFGRIVCHDSFCGDTEDITDGNIAYVANVWIAPEHRNSCVTNMLKVKFFKNTYMCDYFCGLATRKKTQPVKVFKKSDLKGNLFTKGE